MTARKKVVTKPAPKPVDATVDAAAVMAAINVILDSALQSAAGVVAAATGLSVEQAAGLAASDTQHKTDVNVPELITSLNGIVLKDAVDQTHALQVTQTRIIEQGSFYGDLLRQLAVDHRDQNHTKQALAATFPFVVAGDAAEESADDTDRQ
jgi:hypothetical protein